MQPMKPQRRQKTPKVTSADERKLRKYWPAFQEVYLNELCRKPMLKKLRFCLVLLTTRGYDPKKVGEENRGENAA